MKKNQDKLYQVKQPYVKKVAKRPRRSVHNSKLPHWLAKQPFVQKFNKMTRRQKIILLGWGGTSFLVLLTLFTTVYFANSLGSKDKIMNRNKTGVTLLDQSGKTFYEFYNARSDTYVNLSSVSGSVKQAALASEDKDFYKHSGFSVKGIVNAVYQNIRPNGLNNGGSTITQQLVKNSLLSEKRSLVRKYQEIVLSVEIERRYTKDEILEMYLNSVYFGEGAFGIEDASMTYFGIPASQLDLAQASLLIGLLPAPSAYSPISGSPEKAEIRQDYVLSQMVKLNMISSDQNKLADDEPLAFSKNTVDENFKAPHFALMVKDELIKKYGEEKIARSGYQVMTSINLDWQLKAEQAVTKQVNSLSRSKVSNGAAVVIDPSSGEIRALVGSHNWDDENNGKLNMASAKRQPGSSFKPIVYATGIENKDFSAASIWKDEATDFGGGYSPKNYDLRFHGDVTTRQSLANSYNVPAVEALQKASIKKVTETAKELGLTTLDDADSYGLSLALGSGQAKLTEMTNAFATLANQGKYNQLTTITSITNKENRNIYKHKPKNKQVISSQTSYIMSSMMSDSVARGPTFGSSLNLYGNRPAAVKTGTTENYRDAWTIGYTPELAVGVWIGNNDNSPMSSIAGSSGAAPIWRNVMNGILAGTKQSKFEQPSGLSVRSICRASGALAINAGPGTINEYFIPGTLPTKTCNESVTTKDKVEETPKVEQTPEVVKPETNNQDEEVKPNPTTPITTPTSPSPPNSPIVSP